MSEWTLPSWSHEQDVCGTRINDASVPEFRDLPALRVLRVSMTAIASSAAGLRAVLPECLIEA